MKLPLIKQNEIVLEAINSAKKALSLLNKLENSIELEAKVLKSIGVTFQVEGCGRQGNVSRFDERSISNSTVLKLIESIPELTRSSRNTLEREFIFRYGRIDSSIFDPNFCEKFGMRILQLQDKDRNEAFEWVRRARTRDGYAVIRH